MTSAIRPNITARPIRPYIQSDPEVVVVVVPDVEPLELELEDVLVELYGGIYVCVPLDVRPQLEDEEELLPELYDLDEELYDRDEELYDRELELER